MRERRWGAHSAGNRDEAQITRKEGGAQIVRKAGEGVQIVRKRGEVKYAKKEEGHNLLCDKEVGHKLRGWEAHIERIKRRQEAHGVRF